MNKTILTSILFSSLLLFNGCFNEEKKKIESKPIVQKEVIPAGEYHLKDLNGEKLIVKEENGGLILKGSENKVIIFDIFATWCPPCKAAATHLSSLQEKFNENLIIIGLTIENPISNEKLLDFKEKYNASYILTNSSENERLIEKITTNLQVGKRFPIPLMAIYKDSKLVNYYSGAVEEEFIESDIKRALDN
jgi:thiol-disulfide isomerase/thioredoxin